MKNLFLASQVDQVMEKLQEFLRREPSAVSICFVSTAANPKKKKKVQDLVEYQALSKAGFHLMPLDIKDKQLTELQSVVNSVDVVLINGGNTFYLLQEVRHTGFDSVLTDYINSGKPFVGSSAGSLILGPDIAYIAPVDKPELAPELKITRGLGLVPFSIVPHLGNLKYDLIQEEFQKKIANEVIGLNNTQAILVRGDNYEII